MRIESLTDARAQLPKLLDEVERTHERVAITRKGHVAAILVSPDDLAALEDTLELMSDPVAMREIAVARDELRRGDGLDLDELRAFLSAPKDAS